MSINLLLNKQHSAVAMYVQYIMDKQIFLHILHWNNL